MFSAAADFLSSDILVFVAVVAIDAVDAAILWIEL
jgi:hypothetical protein